MAHEIHKTACVLRTVVLVDGTLEAKSAQATSGKQKFDGRLKRIKHEPSEQRDDTNEQKAQNLGFPLGLGVQNVSILKQNAAVRGRKSCFSHRAGSTFLNKWRNFDRKGCIEQ